MIQFYEKLLGVNQVYLDEILFINLAMNCLILWLTARLSRKSFTINRIFWGAFLGSLYVLAVFLPARSIFFTLLAKFILSIAIIMVSFSPGRWQEYFCLLGMFYLVSFTVGGAALACSLFLSVPALSSGGMFILPSFNGWNLAVPFFLILVLGKWGLDYLEQKKWQRLLQVNLMIRLLDKEVKVEGILDTGNKLKEPLTKEPVIVVQYSALKEILPEEIQDYFDKEYDKSLDLDVDLILNSPFATKLCFIPYSCLGEKKGFLLGFRPQAIKLWEKGREIEVIKKAVVAIYRDSFSETAAYQALLPPDLIANVT